MKMRLMVAGMAAAAFAPAAHAATVLVGTCRVATHFSTIQAAVDGSAPGGTVDICAGTYPEQVTITKNLTLAGVADGEQGQVLIVPPPTGLVVDASYASGFPVAAQVLVQNATVTLSSVTVDGTGNGVSGCSPDVVGVFYQNAFGAIKYNLIQNQIISPYASLGGCQSGEGILVQNSGTGTGTVTISGNTVQNWQKNAVTVDGVGLKATIGSNSLYGLGAAMGAAQNGVQLSDGATGTITANHVGDEIWQPDQFGDTGDAASGILVYDSPNVVISNNSLSSTQFAIVVFGDTLISADGAQITGNTVSRTYLYDAVDICGAGSAKVTGNVLQGSDEAGVHLDSSCGGVVSVGNTVTGNSINGACAGILEGSGSGGTTSPDSYVNDATLVMTGSDVCSLAQARGGKRLHPRPLKH